MRKFKTSEKNRTHYVYYNAKGKPTVLKPEADGVDNTWITLLHKEDDEWLDAERRNEYYAPVHYDAYYDGNGDESADCNPYLSDEKTNPLNRIIESIEKQECDEKMKKLQTAISKLQPQQKELIKKKFYENKRNVEIAKEEGVTEAAIRNRLKKIYIQLSKKI